MSIILSLLISHLLTRHLKIVRPQNKWNIAGSSDRKTLYPTSPNFLYLSLYPIPDLRWRNIELLVPVNQGGETSNYWSPLIGKSSY